MLRFALRGDRLCPLMDELTGITEYWEAGGRVAPHTPAMD